MSATIFEFESDFAGSLRCIPMAVRLKLDLVGIKLSLRQWSELGADQRRILLWTPCSTETVDHYRAVVVSLHDSPDVLKHIAPTQGNDWRAGSHVPEVVVEQAMDKQVTPPDPAQWDRLTDLQRFALIKLTRPGHENENFLPAMREFGLVGSKD